MYWQEEHDTDQPFVVPDDVVDLAFAIQCRALPVEHAAALSAAVLKVLPWIRDEPRAGIHTVHGAESGNGWERPAEADGVIYLSRRTRLMIRLPRERIEEAHRLSGQNLDISGHNIAVGAADIRKLGLTTTLYARYVVTAPDQDEQHFVQQAVELLRGRGLRFKKVLCGKTHVLATDEGPLVTRSLLVADLPYEDAVRLQEEGIGHHSYMGCGIFVPHKSI